MLACTVRAPMAAATVRVIVHTLSWEREEEKMKVLREVSLLLRARSAVRLLRGVRSGFSRFRRLRGSIG